MVTDDDRREVARRLRSVAREVDRGGFSETIKHVKLAVFEDLERYRPNGTLARLADLIEPSEPEVRCIAEVKVDGEQLEKLAHDAVVEVTGIDRDALLALADEMDHTDSEVGWTDDAMPHYARRIRETLGVSDDA